MGRTETGVGPVRANTLAAPKKARKSYERAQEELARKKPDHEAAARHLERAVHIYAAFAEAWDLLGILRYRLGDQSRAIDAYRNAIRSDATYVDPYLRLAALAFQGRRMKEAIEFAEAVLRLKPGVMEAHYYRAAACHALDRTECALEAARAIIAKGGDRSYPRIYLITADLLAANGDFRSAAIEYARLIELEPGSRVATAAAARIEDLQNLEKGIR